MDSTTTITQLYERIPLEAMQQVADSYMAWYVQNVTKEHDSRIGALRNELEQNDKEEARLKPSAAELDAMRRLQSNNVTEVDLLDRLVEKGEEWLVLTMHRLDYFERAGLAPHDYPAWCEHALIGAYDWIDAGRLHASKRMFSLQGGGTGPMRTIRPGDVSSAATGETKTVLPPRPEPAPAARPPQAPRAEQPAPRAAAPRSLESEELSTQPVPAATQASPAPQEQFFRTETSPLPAPAARPEAQRPASGPQQPMQRPAGQPGSPAGDIQTRPAPQEAPQLPRSGQVMGSASAGAPPMRAAPTGQAAANAPVNAPSAPTTPQRRPEVQPPTAARPQPQPPLSTPPSGPLAPAPQRPRPAPTWSEAPEQRQDPRFSLDDVELDEMEQDGEQQGFLRKIFRVFTQEN